MAIYFLQHKIIYKNDKHIHYDLSRVGNAMTSATITLFCSPLLLIERVYVIDIALFVTTHP